MSYLADFPQRSGAAYDCLCTKNSTWELVWRKAGSMFNQFSASKNALPFQNDYWHPTYALLKCSWQENVMAVARSRQVAFEKHLYILLPKRSRFFGLWGQ